MDDKDVTKPYRSSFGLVAGSLNGLSLKVFPSTKFAVIMELGVKVTAMDVLGSLFNPTETVCFRVFEDRKDGIFHGAKLECECGKYMGIEETLRQHNEKNRGIFFVVNYGGHDDAAITRINAQFFEMDKGTGVYIRNSYCSAS